MPEVDPVVTLEPHLQEVKRPGLDLHWDASVWRETLGGRGELVDDESQQLAWRREVAVTVEELVNVAVRQSVSATRSRSPSCVLAWYCSNFFLDYLAELTNQCPPGHLREAFSHYSTTV